MRKLAIGTILAVGLGLGLWLGGIFSETAKPELLTVQQIVKNYSLFFSAEYDRADIKQGSFELFPWSGDHFLFRMSTFPPRIGSKVVTEKYISRNGDNLKISTKRYWYLDFSDLQRTFTFPVRAQTRVGGVRTLNVQVKLITHIERLYISKSTAERILRRARGLRPNEVNIWELQVQGGESTFSYFMRRTAEGRCKDYYIYLVSDLRYLDVIAACFERQQFHNLPTFELAVKVKAIDGVALHKGPVPQHSYDYNE